MHTTRADLRQFINNIKGYYGGFHADEGMELWAKTKSFRDYHSMPPIKACYNPMEGLLEVQARFIIAQLVLCIGYCHNLGNTGIYISRRNPHM